MCAAPLMTAPLVCPQCKATFSRSAHLRRHQKTHRAEKPFVCQFCPVASTRKDVIVRHTRNFHPEAVQKEPLQSRSIPTFNGSPTSTASSSELSPASDGNQAGRADLHPVLGHIDMSNEVLRDFQFDPLSFQDHQFSIGIADNVLNTLTGSSITSPGFSQFLASQPKHSASQVLLDQALGNDQNHLISLNVDQSTTSSFAGLTSVDVDYASAQANVALYDTNQCLSAFRFPSKPALLRFVNAFFRHMAPHTPIVHRPTFDVSTVPSPLLIVMMACGALYLCEHSMAAKLHSAAQQLMFQVERGNEKPDRDTQFSLWMFQTYILMSFFGAYGGNSDMEQRAMHVFPFAVQLTRDAFKELKPLHSTMTYKDWIYQESISRCIASTIEIGAAIASTAKEQCFTAPFFDASFPIPCDTSIWLLDEESWRVPLQHQEIHQILSCLFAGQEPYTHISDFGLVAVVSSILWRVCSFEALVGPNHRDLYTNLLVDKLEKAARLIDGILKERNADKEKESSIICPMIKSADGLLNSVFYHLYGSKILAKMKHMIESADVLKGTTDSLRLSELDYSSKLEVALVRAGEALNWDCQVGISYISQVAPHLFPPIGSNSCYEGGLLLSWYLISKPVHIPSLRMRPTIDKLIQDLIPETESLHGPISGDLSKLPLAISAELLSNGSVWQWPLAVSKQLKRYLGGSASNSPFEN
ncbi:hypothetical protein BS50DRAFT_239751 [Corynespora cassiicola Philippines]|uniref:C2H2-type domain-containing protein n=1 Tax=Corynespora cassiicola Philippines TaxID=1448308 RepID=A0A2T2P2M4_CORCC|nr:hypothetical protein BS50DRAFT_239751 [Corynespora cassiicola Philippines]